MCAYTTDHSHHCSAFQEYRDGCSPSEHVQNLPCLSLTNTYVPVITSSCLKHKEFENTRKVTMFTLDENLSP